MQMRPIEKRGITLVELMVAVAIIGILTSIVSIQYPEFRYRTLNAKALLNLRHMKIALFEYFDANGSYPYCLGYADTAASCQNFLHVYGWDQEKDLLISSWTGGGGIFIRAYWGKGGVGDLPDCYLSPYWYEIDTTGALGKGIDAEVIVTRFGDAHFKAEKC